MSTREVDRGQISEMPRTNKMQKKVQGKRSQSVSLSPAQVQGYVQEYILWRREHKKALRHAQGAVKVLLLEQQNVFIEYLSDLSVVAYKDMVRRRRAEISSTTPTEGTEASSTKVVQLPQLPVKAPNSGLDLVAAKGTRLESACNSGIKTTRTIPRTPASPVVPHVVIPVMPQAQGDGEEEDDFTFRTSPRTTELPQLDAGGLRSVPGLPQRATSFKLIAGVQGKTGTLAGLHTNRVLLKGQPSWTE